jgi:hypothetical protein
MQYSYDGFNIEGKNRNELADDVLAILKDRGVTFRSGRPEYVEFSLDGSVSIRFFGNKGNEPWSGNVKFTCPYPPDKIMLTNPAVIADICQQGIDNLGVG